MSWWAEAERDFYFKCPVGHEFALRAQSQQDPRECECPLESCGKKANRTGFSAVDFGAPMVKTFYEQNGRKAVRYRNNDGTTSHISESKIRYMETGRTDGVYTEAYDKKEITDAATRARKEKYLSEKYSMGRKKGK